MTDKIFDNSKGTEGITWTIRSEDEFVHLLDKEKELCTPAEKLDRIIIVTPTMTFTFSKIRSEANWNQRSRKMEEFNLKQ